MLSDGTTVLRDGTRVLLDGTKILSDGIKVLSDGTRVLSDGTKVLSDGTKVLSDGTKVLSDGTKVLSDGTVIAAGDEDDLGGYADGTAVALEGNAALTKKKSMGSMRGKVAGWGRRGDADVVNIYNSDGTLRDNRDQTGGDSESEHTRGGKRQHRLRRKGKRSGRTDPNVMTYERFMREGGVSALGYLAKYCIINEAQERQFRAVFTNIDRDHDGLVTFTELDFGLKTVNRHLISQKETDYVTTILEVGQCHSPPTVPQCHSPHADLPRLQARLQALCSHGRPL